ncbi:hypothetical protein COC42_11965 [Sphingomonas spermidinifaciens]|uniref:DUF3955 domain-containing protein n=1 Tax=Sphingomonas spermidinifaciens TaxID=1141889 RepID=A0A2A4B3F6_9SPHN|nr:hypothetical protein COC42_11965 [Sphingomonas spermidinifaciens]
MRKFLVGLLVAIGVLLAGTTGLCIGRYPVSLPSLINQPRPMLLVSPFLLVGIIPCALGVIISKAGLCMKRSSDRDDA